MTEPLFFDCLTDAQIWSLFDSGVLQAYLLPGDVFQRLERLAPTYGCYLFAWPADKPLPGLQDIIPSLALSRQGASRHPPEYAFERPLCAERLRSEIAAFCARARVDLPMESGRIHVITLHPPIELRAGPYLEPPGHDLTAMSISELEAYLDAMLRLDEGDEEVVRETPTASGM
jgi:hypothetical protein